MLESTLRVTVNHMIIATSLHVLEKFRFYDYFAECEIGV